ncbi:MAG: T9SS type A sorting domain-containing protein [Saprospiraceae bacterium]|nr:T9SS type A sorting domain-containing protein [Saprospiraceae bacterium]MCF8251814.1 T9SS type A sorting domain-containing protein [Saprospiraceae bacterium]MCF8281468.1 T9SS type A sorting domain-containing protein [Bacteroidales bacterium]MCF8313528.1 T9SS type A sorting domain-containing protein [Saprospiraceae bacterium]MCF8442249.1 T9SS type A sorting domain-containing protein [Saprospiraceae bacterium]
MRTTLHVLILLTLALLLSPISPKAQTLGDPADLPFTLDLEEVTQASIPGLHSFAFGKVDEWWVVIGGRINGLHGFFIATGFPEDKANVEVLLIHPDNGTVLSFEVEDMNLPFGDALHSTNPQYAQDSDWLYIAGGYGKDIASGEFRTFPVLTAVDLLLLKTKLLAGENPAAAFRQTEVPQLKACGGEMEKMGDWFYLVGGHEFSGLYNQNGPPQFTQVYTNEIRRFKITNNTASLAITDYTAHHDEANLHRRDFTLSPVIRPNGSEALCLYGGVFRPDEDLPFYNPIFIAEDNIFEMDASYEQLFSQYTCPAVPLFDSLDGSMNTLFFGGLSVHFWNNGLQYDSKVPFIKDITTFRRQADGTSQEFVMPQSFDELLGANMVFVPSENAPHYPNEVLKLRAMSGPTFVGHLFGGIKAEIPNITPSSANQRMFKVYITPKPTVSSTAEATAPSLQVFPNPFSNDDFLHIESLSPINHCELLRVDSQVLAAYSQTASTGFAELKQMLQGLPSGVYFLKYGGNNDTGVLKLVKQ